MYSCLKCYRGPRRARAASPGCALCGASHVAPCPCGVKDKVEGGIVEAKKERRNNDKARMTCGLSVCLSVCLNLDMDYIFPLKNREGFRKGQEPLPELQGGVRGGTAPLNGPRQKILYIPMYVHMFAYISLQS